MQSEPQSSDDSDAPHSARRPIKEVNKLIRDKLVKNFNQNEFLPDADCKQIVYGDIFEQWFSGEQPGLSEWIQEHASKLFLIVTHIYQVGSSGSNQKIVTTKMRQLYEQRIGDSFLPLTFTCKCKKLKRHHGCVRNDRAHEVFRIWSDAERSEFLRLQNKFRAPVFRKEEFIYELGEENILPIRALNGPRSVDDRGCFSEVERLELKQEHQDTFDKVGHPKHKILCLRLISS